MLTSQQTLFGCAPENKSSPLTVSSSLAVASINVNDFVEFKDRYWYLKPQKLEDWKPSDIFYIAATKYLAFTVTETWKVEENLFPRYQLVQDAIWHCIREELSVYFDNVARRIKLDELQICCEQLWNQEMFAYDQQGEKVGYRKTLWNITDKSSFQEMQMQKFHWMILMHFVLKDQGC